MADEDAARGKYFLDHPQAQRKAAIEPDRVTDDPGWETMAAIEWISDLFHDPTSPSIGPGFVKLTVQSRRISAKTVVATLRTETIKR